MQLAAAMVVALLVHAPGPTAPTVEGAEAAFAAGDYDAAADLYAQLYADSGDPGHLYGGAQAHRRAERWSDAIALYDKFVLHAEPLLAGLEGAKRQSLQLMIDNAKQQADAAREELPAPPEADPIEPDPIDAEAVEAQREDPVPAPLPRPQASASPPTERLDGSGSDRARTRPWSRDPAAITLVSVGSAVLLAGVGMFVASAVIDDTAERAATDHDDFLARVDRAATLQQVAPAFVATGAALVIGGAIRFAVVRKRSAVRAGVGTLEVRF